MRMSIIPPMFPIQYYMDKRNKMENAKNLSGTGSKKTVLSDRFLSTQKYTHTLSKIATFQRFDLLTAAERKVTPSNTPAQVVYTI